MKTATFFSAAIVVAVASGAVGCGILDKLKKDKSSSSSEADSDGEKTNSKAVYCFHKDEGTCDEHPDGDLLDLVKDTCKELKGDYGKGECPKPERMGSCQRTDLEGKNPGTKTVYYYGGSSNPFPSDAKEDCEGASAIIKGKLTLEPDAEKNALAKAMPSADKIKASCMDPGKVCSDNITLLGGADNEKKICELGSGKFATTPCPTADLIGSCLISGEVKRYYKDTPIGQANLKKDCEEVLKGHYFDAKAGGAETAKNDDPKPTDPAPKTAAPTQPASGTKTDKPADKPAADKTPPKPADTGKPATPPAKTADPKAPPPKSSAPAKH